MRHQRQTAKSFQSNTQLSLTDTAQLKAKSLQHQNGILVLPASWMRVMTSANAITPRSPSSPYVLTDSWLLLASFSPTTHITGVFAFSAFLINFPILSPAHSGNPLHICMSQADTAQLKHGLFLSDIQEESWVADNTQLLRHGHACAGASHHVCTNAHSPYVHTRTITMRAHMHNHHVTMHCCIMPIQVLSCIIIISTLSVS